MEFYCIVLLMTLKKMILIPKNVAENSKYKSLWHKKLIVLEWYNFVLSDSGARSENEPILRNNHVALKFIPVLHLNPLRVPLFCYGPR